MVKDLRQRIVALSNAHNMVRPDHSQQHKAAQLGDLIAALLEPYSNKHFNSEQVHISNSKSTCRREIRRGSRVGRARVGYKLHQIWGAMESKGTLEVKCRAEGGEVEVVWTENGGTANFKTGRAVRVWYQARD